MKRIITLLLVVAIVVAGVIFLPKLVHTCDGCDKFFVGTGYEPNVIVDFVNSDEQTICKECAETQHALSILTGKSVEDFRKKLFE